MKFTALFSLIGLAIATPALADCPAAPLGTPVVNGIETIEVCHTGYLSLLDPTSKEARIVTHGLTANPIGAVPKSGTWHGGCNRALMTLALNDVFDLDLGNLV